MSVTRVRIPEEQQERRMINGSGSNGSSFIGSEKHVEFDGHSAGGINIPGGLRMAVTPERPAAPVNGIDSQHNRPAPRPAPEPIGWDRKITFEGTTAGGINIPGGLRAPAPRRA